MAARLNRISTHSAPPTSPPCSGNVAVGSDVPNFKDAYMPGDPIIFLAAYRDQGKGSATQFRVIRPDQTVHQTWSFDLASQAGAPDFYNASYWYWNMSVPAGAPTRANTPPTPPTPRCRNMAALSNGSTR